MDAKGPMHGYHPRWVDVLREEFSNPETGFLAFSQLANQAHPSYQSLDYTTFCAMVKPLMGLVFPEVITACELLIRDLRAGNMGSSALQLAKLAKDLSDTEVVFAWSILVSSLSDHNGIPSNDTDLDCMKFIHKHLSNRVLGAYGIPLGPPGVGAMPNFAGRNRV